MVRPTGTGEGERGGRWESWAWWACGLAAVVRVLAAVTLGGAVTKGQVKVPLFVHVVFWAPKSEFHPADWSRWGMGGLGGASSEGAGGKKGERKGDEGEWKGSHASEG
jgi:hypothetical protein